MSKYLVPALVLAGAGAAVYVLTRPASSTAQPPVEPATGAQDPVIEVAGVGSVQIPGIPWYIRSAADIEALVKLEAQRVAMGGRLNTRPRACAGGNCG